jgi:hypothetical protein
MRTAILLSGLLWGMIGGYCLAAHLVLHHFFRLYDPRTYLLVLAVELAAGFLGVFLAAGVFFPRERREHRSDETLTQLVRHVRQLRSRPPVARRPSVR